MIYTLTLNPAVDYVVHIDSLKAGRIMRSGSEQIFFGGKGINVSTVLNELGVHSVATGFLAGFTGLAIGKGLADAGIDCDFVYIEKGFTRINVKIRAESETDINGAGPDISHAELEALMSRLSRLSRGDTLVMAGSVPKSLPSNVYEMIMESLSAEGVRFAVDSSGASLINALKFRPFLVKPNAEELGQIFLCEISGVDDAEKYARELQGMGAKNVIVSMGGDGAVLVDENGVLHIQPPFSGTAVNTVGAGDSMVAGFLAGYERSGDYDYSLRLGAAVGAATAFSEGLAKRAQIIELMGH